MLLGIELLLGLAIVPAANAAPCRTFTDPQGSKQTVCIVEIKRSAKYPWEYRVILSRNGVKQPQKRYHCRDGKPFPIEGDPVRVNAEGMTIPMPLAEPGDWICWLVKRS